MLARLVLGFGLCEITKDFVVTSHWLSEVAFGKETGPRSDTLAPDRLVIERLRA